MVKEEVKVGLFWNVPLDFPDLIDVVRDTLHGADYMREEDPKIYVSSKTGRGPLSDNWIEEYWQECKVGRSGHCIFSW